MATVSNRTSDPLAVAPWAAEASQDSKSEQYLAQRFAAASSDFKVMTVTTFLLGLAVAAVAWLVGGVLVEHWLVPGGLPAWARWVWFALGVVASVLAVGWWLGPLFLYRVNLVYAARAIERDHPELHNDLVNAVLVRERSGDSAEAVVKSLRRRAARRLSRVPDEGVVDRTPAVRLAWVLAALVCLTFVYGVLAPKNFVASAARLAAPWGAIAAPARVQIQPPVLSWRVPGEDPQPAAGDRSRAIDVAGGIAELVRGRQVVVSSEIDGLKSEERPMLVVTPLRDDGVIDTAAAPWRMPMTLAAGGVRSVVLPDAERGLDHGVDLVILAGDNRSDRIRLVVVDAPTLMVRELRYDYPEYMGRESETIAWQGDIRGVEGTRVTIVAEANRPLDNAAVDLGCDNRKNVSLALARPEGTTGKATITLELNAERTAARFGSYRFIYRPRAASAYRPEQDVVGRLEHLVEVFPDLAPEVAIEVPREKVLRVPPDAPVTVGVQAVDPDFGLAIVRVDTRVKGGEVRPGGNLLVGKPRLNFRGAATLIPQTLGAGPGSVLEYRAVAIDTRPERPNETVTEWQSLEIDSSAPPQEPPPQRNDPDKSQDGDAPPQGEQGEQQDSDQQPGKEQGNAGGEQDGDGDGAMEPGEGQQGQGQQGQGEGRDGEAQQGEGKQGEGKQGEGQQGQGEGRDGEAQQGERSGGKNAPRPQQTVAADGTNDGEAMERLLDDKRRSDQPDQPRDKNADQQQPAGDEQPGQPPNEKSNDKSACRDAEGKPCGKSGCSSCSGGKSSQGQGEGQGEGEGQQGQGQGEGRDGKARQGQDGGQSAGEADEPGATPAGDGGQVGLGGQAGGADSRGGPGDANAPLERRDMEWGDQNLEHARNAADLAIEHLRDSLARGRTDVLDELGWTAEQAQAFLGRWEQMKRLADSDSPRQRAEFERAVRSLGLRPDGVQTSRDVPADRKGGQAEGRRSKPPSDYREQFKAFMRGTSVE